MLLLIVNNSKEKMYMICTSTVAFDTNDLDLRSILQLEENTRLKARTHWDEFRARYSPTFNASWLNKGRQCECAHRREKRHA